MSVTIAPSNISGTLAAPASKSVMQRYIAGALLAQGTTTIANAGFNNDVQAAIQLATALGAEITHTGSEVVVQGGFKPIGNTLHAGESGLSIRLFTPIAALHNGQIKITGEGSLTTRPMDAFEAPFANTSATFKSTNSFLPLYVEGPLTGGTTELDGSIGSQFLTGFLFAMSATGNHAEILVKNLTSKPYIDLTLSVLEEFGISVKNHNYKRFVIEARQQFKPANLLAEGDWSGAAFLLVAGAIAGSVKVQNLKTNSTQADKAILVALESAGAEIEMDENGISVKKRQLNAFEFDATECPDLFPPLVSLAAACKGVTKIKGLHRLKHKESDRGVVLQAEYAKLGIAIELIGDQMHITGGRSTGGTLSSNNDHRIAMAAAVTALISEAPVEITEPYAINKSYPEFYKHMDSLSV